MSIRRVPLRWASTQDQLGDALRALGERESGTARLEESVATFLAALEEKAPDRLPFSWVITQLNLGRALSILGERKNDPVLLQQASSDYTGALEVFAGGASDYFADQCRKRLDQVRTALNKNGQ